MKGKGLKRTKMRVLIFCCLVRGNLISTRGDMIFGGSLVGSAFLNGAGSLLKQQAISLPIDFSSTSAYLYNHNKIINIKQKKEHKCFFDALQLPETALTTLEITSSQRPFLVLVSYCDLYSCFFSFLLFF